MNSVQPGQRWINHARPELGLGMVIAAEGRTVTLRFGDDERDHIFALESAPLSRIRFSVGDVVRLVDGDRVAVESVEDGDGVLVYRGRSTDGRLLEFIETAIASNQSFNRPGERLLHGHIDEDRWFSLRFRTLENRHRLYRDPMWGLLGGRTALLPHQLYVANEVARRHAPRVLLADEVGLGKTIEAGLIAHYQLVTERIRRVLVLVPESLVHQWLVEMLRRFNLMFRVFDGERCDAMDPAAEDDDAGHEERLRNPFVEEQLVLTSREFLLAEPRRGRQCVDAGWDLLIVDEAHHLRFDESGKSQAYALVEALAEASSGVLLLTGTPHQLGAAGHFARLRLLDPDRYHDAAQLESEQQDFEPVADLVEELLGDEQLSGAVVGELARRQVMDLHDDDRSLDQRATRDRMIDRLLDRFGTGRVMFRNTRGSVAGFARRRLVAHPLKADAALFDAAAIGVEAVLYPERSLIESADDARWARVDPRVAWLTSWLVENAPEKALVICSSLDTAVALARVLKLAEGVHCAAFHEGLGLVERDRAAAWFADREQGCQALICSEIGSEGRNFQFAHHLVLFDLPLQPDLLEQRIGRLDRIGREGDVSIHVPFLEHTAQQRLFFWYHHGLDAFERVGTVGQLVYERLGPRLAEWLCRPQASDGDSLVDDARALREGFERQMRAGRDRLLEYHSCRPGRAGRLVEDGRRADQDSSLRDWLELASGCYDITLEGYRLNSVMLRPGARLLTPIPGLPDDGMAATFDRNTALENEDLRFLTWEHPVVEAIADLVLNTERGNASIAALRHPALPRARLAVECVFVVEAPLFARPELACYVPPLLVSSIYDERGGRLDPELDHDIIDASWVPLKPRAARQIVALKRELLQRMLDAAGVEINQRAASLLRNHGRGGLEDLKEELARLLYLEKVNPNVRRDEIDHHTALVDVVAEALKEPRVRLDAVRVLIGL